MKIGHARIQISYRPGSGRRGVATDRGPRRVVGATDVRPVLRLGDRPSAERMIIAACPSSTARRPASSVMTAIRVSPSSWRIITAGIPLPAWRIFS